MESVVFIPAKTLQAVLSSFHNSQHQMGTIPSGTNPDTALHKPLIQKKNCPFVSLLYESLVHPPETLYLLPDTNRHTKTHPLFSPRNNP